MPRSPLSSVALFVILTVAHLVDAKESKATDLQDSTWSFPWVTVLTTLACAVALPKLVGVLFQDIFASQWNPSGKVVVITGASSGIGEELARRYALLGAKLVLCARRESELEAVAKKCRSLGAQVEAVIADVTKQEQCKELIQRALDKFGGIDCLILNAGISMGCNFEEVSEDELDMFHRLMEVNYYGCVYCTHYALPALKKAARPAHIVVISSLAGKGGTPQRTGYSASKFAVHGFFEALRCELSKYGILVTIICPGFVKTNINATRLGPTPASFDTSIAMPVEECGKLIVSAVAKGKREEVMTMQGKIGQYIRFFLPALFDRIITRTIQTQTSRQEK